MTLKRWTLLPVIAVDDRGKRPTGKEIIESNASDRKAKNPKLVKDPFLKVVEYPTPNIIVAKGKTIYTEKSVVEHYNYLNVKARKQRETAEDKLRSIQPPQLISALDKKNHLMEIVVIQPPITGDPQRKMIAEFKLNMSQFSIVDIVDLFKQTRELTCSELISTSVSKENLQRDYRKLESKLKTEQGEKKTLQIKKNNINRKHQQS